MEDAKIENTQNLGVTVAIEGVLVPCCSIISRQNTIDDIFMNIKVNESSKQFIKKIKDMVDIHNSLSLAISLEKQQLPSELMVASYDCLSGEVTAIYKSAKEVERMHGLSASDITRVCLNERNHVNNFGWKFVDE